VLVYDPRELLGVTTVRLRVARVLQQHDMRVLEAVTTHRAHVV
jgi:hypothetical protein